MRHIKKILLSVLVIALSLSSAAFGASAASDTGSAPCVFVDPYGYTDVGAGWYDKWVCSYGYPDIFSNGDNLFHPDQAITRMEFARLLHEALGISINYFAATDIGDYFDDVPAGDAGANALYDLVTCGIIDTTGSFRPSETLDRDEMIHFVMNAFYYEIGSDYALPDLALQPFSDDADIIVGYRGDVSRAAVLGFINGAGDNLLLPRKAATRAEAVTVVGRLAELLKADYGSNVSVKATAKEADGKLVMTLAILNNTENTVTIDHSSAQKFDFQILSEAGKELYRWSDGRMFTPALTTTEIAPGTEAAFSVELDADAYSAIRADACTVKAYIAGTSADFTVNPDGYLVRSIQAS